MFPLACTVGHKSRGAVCFFLCLWFCFHILFVNASSGSTSGTLVQWSRLRIEQCEAFSAFGKSPNAISEKIISSESVRRRHFQWQALRLFHSLAKKIAINSEIHLAQKMAFTFLYEAVALYLSVRGFLIWRDFGSDLASCLPCEVVARARKGCVRTCSLRWLGVRVGPSVGMRALLVRLSSQWKFCQKCSLFHCQFRRPHLSDLSSRAQWTLLIPGFLLKQPSQNSAFKSYLCLTDFKGPLLQLD